MLPHEKETMQHTTGGEEESKVVDQIHAKNFDSIEDD
jgi:hypothetical protein